MKWKCLSILEAEKDVFFGYRFRLPVLGIFGQSSRIAPHRRVAARLSFDETYIAHAALVSLHHRLLFDHIASPAIVFPFMWPTESRDELVF